MYKGVPTQLLGHFVIFPLVFCAGGIPDVKGGIRDICVCIVGMRNIYVSVGGESDLYLYHVTCTIVFPRAQMKPRKERDGAVEKLILIKIIEQGDGSGFPVLTCAASPCDGEFWDGILGSWGYPSLSFGRADPSHGHQEPSQTRSPSLARSLCVRRSGTRTE